MREHVRVLLSFVGPVLLALAPATGGTARADEKVLFNRDVRPILADTCFKCHGRDANARKAELRLDTAEGATADLGLGDGHGAIVPGQLDQSEAYRRITSDDPEDHMPPPKSGLARTAAQIDVIRRWIAQGAEYQLHWSLIKPTASPLPEVKAARWPRHPIAR